MLTVNFHERISARECLEHSWMRAAEVIPTRKRSTIVPPPPEIIGIAKKVKEEVVPKRSRAELRALFRMAQNTVRFTWRICNLRRLKQGVDRRDLRQRPYRNVEVCLHLFFLVLILIFV